MLNVIVTNQQHHARQTVLDISQTWKTRKIHKAFRDLERPQHHNSREQGTGEQGNKRRGNRGVGEQGGRRGGEQGSRRGGEQKRRAGSRGVGGGESRGWDQGRQRIRQRPNVKLADTLRS